jgi:D-Tyr-tRNAtyr deacylase
MNLSIKDCNGENDYCSQFTLRTYQKKGNRPSSRPPSPEIAIPLYENSLLKWN